MLAAYSSGVIKRALHSVDAYAAPAMPACSASSKGRATRCTVLGLIGRGVVLKKGGCPSTGRGCGLNLQNLYFFLQNQYNLPWQKGAVNRGQNWLFNRYNRPLSG